jgi:hypothetical protein
MTEFTASRKTSGRARGYIAAYRPQARTKALLDDVLAVLDEYRDYWPLTCRQVYYRLVGVRGYEKTEAFYATMCHHVANARRARLIDFDAIRDDGVTVVSVGHFDNEDHFRRHVRRLATSYRRNVMASQPRHIEVWCEAAGMILQLSDVAEDYSIDVRSSGGFDSLTAKKAMADRICSIGKPASILHLGDFDPSGLDMFEVVAEDVEAFVLADRPWNDISVTFRRVALTAEQVAHYRLPTAPPKVSDSRSRRWTGETCQLEALTPVQIADLLRGAIEREIDTDLLNNDRILERLERADLSKQLLTGPST